MNFLTIISGVTGIQVDLFFTEKNPFGEAQSVALAGARPFAVLRGFCWLVQQHVGSLE